MYRQHTQLAHIAIAQANAHSQHSKKANTHALSMCRHTVICKPTRATHCCETTSGTAHVESQSIHKTNDASWLCIGPQSSVASLPPCQRRVIADAQSTVHAHFKPWQFPPFDNHGCHGDSIAASVVSVGAAVGDLWLHLLPRGAGQHRLHPVRQAWPCPPPSQVPPKAYRVVSQRSRIEYSLLAFMLCRRFCCQRYPLIQLEIFSSQYFCMSPNLSVCPAASPFFQMAQIFWPLDTLRYLSITNNHW